jgi:glycine cleavage system transcriptional repressor
LSSEIWSFSAVGQDRPGIVAALSKLLYEHDCNLSDSSMTILAGQFAIVLILETGQKTDPEALAQAIDGLGREWHLQVKAGPLEAGTPDDTEHPGASLLVSVYGADQAGLTWKVADCIAAHKYNVTDLSTKKIEGSAPVYILLLEIESGPEAIAPSKLESALQSLGKELGCSVTVKPVEASEL